MQNKVVWTLDLALQPHLRASKLVARSEMLSAAQWANAAAAGWTTISQARFGVELGTIQAQLRGNGTAGRPQQELGYLWSLPRERAITWHWDPYLCDVLVPGFREDMLGARLVRCDDLKAAMHRAFTTWSDNHVLLSFADVSAECATLGYERHCPLAEVVISAMGGTVGPPLHPPPPTLPSTAEIASLPSFSLFRRGAKVRRRPQQTTGGNACATHSSLRCSGQSGASLVR